MTSYVPLPDLAAAIRNAPATDAIQTFKIFGIAVHNAKLVKGRAGKGPTDPQNLRHVREKVAELEHGLQEEMTRYGIMATHLLSPFRTRVTLELIYLNIEKLVEDPNSYLFERAGDLVTVAEHWLINCAMHPECDRDGSLRRRWSEYLQEQPTYEPLQDPEVRFANQVHSLGEEDLFSNCPGLEQIIHRLYSVECYRHVKESYLLQYFFRLGATAVHFWTHMWQAHGVQRGRPLPLDDSHVQYALHGIKLTLSYEIQDWTSEIPRQVRQEFSLHNFGGEFLFLLNHVFPNIIAPHGSTIREDMFGWEMHQYIMRCATSAGVNSRVLTGVNPGRVVLNPAPENGSRAFYQPHIPYVRYPDDYQPREQQDVELEAYGPVIKPGNVAELGYPAEGTICTICQHDFETTEINVEMGPCYELYMCGHMFHGRCLYDLLNGVHVDEVKCCNCRTTICDARPRRVKQT